MIFSKLWAQLKNKSFREEYVAAQAKRSIPFQIRAIMEKRGISQNELAEKSGLSQGVISRAANPAYGNLTLNTIIRVAAGLDVAFVGKFVPFSKLVDHFDHLNAAEILDVPTFDEESAQAAASQQIRQEAEAAIKRISMPHAAESAPAIGFALVVDRQRLDDAPKQVSLFRPDVSIVRGSDALRSFNERHATVTAKLQPQQPAA